MIQKFGFWLCGNVYRNYFVFRGKGIHPINILNFAKSVIVNINSLFVKVGRSEKNTQQYDITFRMNHELAVIFSNYAFCKIEGKAGFGSAIWLMDPLWLQAH